MVLAPVKALEDATEFAMLDELSEMIIPADAHSPGARAAKVATFIDARLAEAWDQKDRTDWRAGLALVDRLSQESHKAPFMKASVDQRLAVLTRMAQNENDPKKPEERFFKELKSRVVYAYYTSEIGIKQEMEYKGNVNGVRRNRPIPATARVSPRVQAEPESTARRRATLPGAAPATSFSQQRAHH
jgi:hypothetical protein